ncbi:hypothetical protein FXO38_33101 [Capsicum annuum]|nr:hypothetical protein FXO38_33101 [Capsicum annuum]
MEELEQLDLPPWSIASYHPGTSSISSLTGSPVQIDYKVNEPQVVIEHNSFDDFSTLPLQHLKIRSIHVSGTVHAPQSKNDKTTDMNLKFNDLERLMNDKFSEVLKSLHQKNENVEKENIGKQIPQEGEHLDDVRDVADHSNADSPYIVSNKPIEMEGPNVNQAPSTVKDSQFDEMENIEKQLPQKAEHLNDVSNDVGPSNADNPKIKTDKHAEIEGANVNQALSLVKVSQHAEMDDGTTSLLDNMVEEVQPLESITPFQVSDMAMTVFKAPPTIPDDSKGKKKLVATKSKKYPFEGYNISGESPTELMEVFEDWTKEGLYKQHLNKKDKDDHYKVQCVTLGFHGCKELSTQDAFARTDEVAHIEKSLINSIKGMSTPVGQPWHHVNEVFILINYNGVFYWVLAVIALKEQYIRVYDSIYSSRNRALPSEVQKLKTMLPTYLQYSKFFEQKDCGVFAAVYAEYLSEVLSILSSGIDA